jgi:hypothetical protein
MGKNNHRYLLRACTIAGTSLSWKNEVVIAMSQGYVTLGGVCIALTSYSLCIHFLYPGSSKEAPWIQVSFEMGSGLALCTTARICSVH